MSESNDRSVDTTPMGPAHDPDCPPNVARRIEQDVQYRREIADIERNLAHRLAVLKREAMAQCDEAWFRAKARVQGK